MTNVAGHTAKAKFSVGEQVIISARSSLGHCRTPVYLRGHMGTVIEVAGRYRDPEKLAYHKPGLPAPYLYRVRFTQSDLWSGYTGSVDDELEADIFEHWLEPVDKGESE